MYPGIFVTEVPGVPVGAAGAAVVPAVGAEVGAGVCVGAVGVDAGAVGAGVGAGVGVGHGGYKGGPHNCANDEAQNVTDSKMNKAALGKENLNICLHLLRKVSIPSVGPCAGANCHRDVCQV